MAILLLDMIIYIIYNTLGRDVEVRKLLVSRWKYSYQTSWRPSMVNTSFEYMTIIIIVDFRNCDGSYLASASFDKSVKIGQLDNSGNVSV